MSVILVTGATGHVGGQVVGQLLETGVMVRAFVRNSKSGGLPSRVEAVCGDFTKPETFDRALNDVDAVFLMWPLLTTDHAQAIVRATAKRARRIVFLSSLAVRDDVDQQSNPIAQIHADIERLIEESGLEWTFLRPGGFAANTLWWAPQIRGEGVVRWPYGAAARALIHERDIAAVAVRALVEDGHAGKKYHLSGPQAQTQVEQVKIIGEVIGRRLRFEEIPSEVAREQLFTDIPPALVDAILDAHAGFVRNPEPTSRSVEQITGTPARTFREWAIDHAADFLQESRPSDSLPGIKRPSVDLAGLRVGITGATSGLGLALVRELLDRSAQVAFVARSRERVERVVREQHGAHGIVGDVSKKEDAYPIAMQIVGALGGLDVLINNASDLGPAFLMPLADTECEDMERALATNVLGPFRLTKALLGSLASSAREGCGAVVVNISSDAALTPYPLWGAYGASKAALHQLTRIWNEELVSEGIQCISLDPGDMDTPLHALAVPEADRSTLKHPETAAREIIDAIGVALLRHPVDFDKTQEALV
jgi:NAD(P)-dependent dehydrogenase (short-subunit alcohol dehydrogenase family)